MKKKRSQPSQEHFLAEQQRKEAKAKQAQHEAHLRLRQELGDNNTNQYRQ